jgi:hypothetical protein
VSERTGHDRRGGARVGWPAAQSALERDAYLFRELMDPHELEPMELVAGDRVASDAARVESLRWTARGAVEDWLEAKR